MARPTKHFDLSGDERMVDFFARGRPTPWVARELGASERTVRRRRVVLAGRVAVRQRELAAKLPVLADDDELGESVPEAPRATIQGWLDNAKVIANEAHAAGDRHAVASMIRLAIVLLRRLVALEGPPVAPPSPAIDWPTLQASVRQRFAERLAAVEAES